MFRCVKHNLRPLDTLCPSAYRNAMTAHALSGKDQRLFDEVLESFMRTSEKDRSYIEHARVRAWKTFEHLPMGSGHEVILDVGSMRGLFAPAYIEIWHYAEVHLLGSDTSTREIKRETNSRAYRFPAARCNIEIEKWPYPDETFDTIVCTEVLEHLVFDPVFAVNEMCRVLKPGGKALVTVPNAASDECLSYLVNDMQPGFLRNYISDALRSGKRTLDTVYNLGHFHEYTRREIESLFSATGFALLALKGLSAAPALLDSWRFRFLRSMVHLLFPRSRRIRENQLLVIAQKKAFTPTDQLPQRFPSPLYRKL